MARCKTTSYWILLLAVLFLGSAVMSVGQTQARYTADTTVLNTVVLTGSDAVTSNCLVSDSTQIVLLGELTNDQPVTATFTLNALQAVSDVLYWYITGGNMVGISLEFAMTEGEGALGDDHTLVMEAGSKAEVTMTIAAISEITAEKTVDVVVMCENLTGTFRVTLMPSAEEEPSEPDEEETLPDESGGEGSEEETQPGESGGEGSEEETQPGESGGEGSEEETQPGESGGEGGEEETQPEETGSGESQTESTDPTVSESEEAASEPEVTEVTEGETEETTAPGESETAEATVSTYNTGEETGEENTEAAPVAETETESGSGEESGGGETTEETPDDSSGSTEEPLTENTEEPEDPAEGENTETPGEDNTGDPEDPDDSADDTGEGTDTPDDTGEDTGDPEDPDQTGGDTGESTDTPTEPDEEPETTVLTHVSLKTISQFEITSRLPVSVLLAGEADSLTIGLAGGEPFPAFTRYSLDGGKTYYMLYFGGYIRINGAFDALAVVESLMWDLQMDFSHTNISVDTEITLEALAGLDGQTAAVSTAVTKPAAGTTVMEATRILTKVKTAAATDVAALAETETEPAADSYFVVSLPVGWDSCQVEYEVLFLQAGEKGNSYQTVELSEDGLYGRLDYPNRTLTIGLGSDLPAAGTYRLIIRGNYEGVCFQKMQMTFFINYSTRSDAE